VAISISHFENQQIHLARDYHQHSLGFSGDDLGIDYPNWLHSFFGSRFLPGEVVVLIQTLGGFELEDGLDLGIIGGGLGGQFDSVLVHNQAGGVLEEVEAQQSGVVASITGTQRVFLTRSSDHQVFLKFEQLCSLHIYGMSVPSHSQNQLALLSEAECSFRGGLVVFQVEAKRRGQRVGLVGEILELVHLGFGVDHRQTPLVFGLGVVGSSNVFEVCLVLGDESHGEDVDDHDELGFTDYNDQARECGVFS
jgi:hypothetical protein